MEEVRGGSRPTSHREGRLRGGVRPEVTRAVELKRRIARCLGGALERRELSKGEIARAMGTSRSSLDRLLDPEEAGLTLKTLVRAAAVFGLELVVELRPSREERRR